MTRKWFFEFVTPKNHPWAFKNHRNVLYSSQGTHWALKFCSSSIRRKLLAITGFCHFLTLDLTSEVTGWPRILSLYNIFFVSRRSTCSFFFRETLAQSGRDGKRGSYYPSPPCRGRMRNGLCRRGLNSNHHHQEVPCTKALVGASQGPGIELIRAQTLLC